MHLVRGEGVWLHRCRRQCLSRRLQQCRLGRPLPSARRGGDRAAGRDPEHAHTLSQRVIIAYAERLLASSRPRSRTSCSPAPAARPTTLRCASPRVSTGGTGFLVTDLAYHGGTDAIAGLSPSFGPFVDLGDACAYRPGARQHADSEGPDRRGSLPTREAGDRRYEAARHHARGAASSIHLFERRRVRRACRFLKGGGRSDPGAGGLFIADEVQPGFGRTGETMWGFARHGVEPDIVTMGKPMGNGHPIAAMVVKPEIVKRFGSQSRYFNTFGGNPVSCAAGMAVLDVIENEGLQRNAYAVGRQLLADLRALAEELPLIADIRGAGLFIGVELEPELPGRSSADITASVVNGLRERRILISATGPRGNVLKIVRRLCFRPITRSSSLRFCQKCSHH